MDDGKSSLIGRLLYDSKAIFEDQILSLERASARRGNEGLELALLTDGLRAEREQNITIDVAYRYFSTPRRKFIIADTPGHLQYTRNMVTGTSTADLSVVLVDARKGVLEQSKRHAAISSLLGVPRIVVAVNKMDLVDFSREVFDGIVREFGLFAARLGVRCDYVPVSALLGDNVVTRSANLSWYDGPPLLELLETVPVEREEPAGFRLPVQTIIRPDQDFRGFAGRVEGGTVRVGDEVEVAASGRRSRVASLHVAGVPAREARTGDAVVLAIEDEVDASRGDLFVSPLAPPAVSDRVEAVVCWLHESPLRVGRRYTLLHGTRRVPAIVESVLHRIEVDTLIPFPASELGVNDLGRIVVRTASPLHFDPYDANRATGSFVLADPTTCATLAAGMIQGTPQTAVAESRPGRIAAYAGSLADARRLGEDLRRFGRPVLVTPLAETAREAAEQGFDVLHVGGIGGPSVSGDDALARALAVFEGGDA